MTLSAWRQTLSTEAMGAAEYDKFMDDAKADKEYKHKTEVKTKLEKVPGRVRDCPLQVNEELAKANDDFEVLKPECIEVKVSYEERVQARQDETDALKEAQDLGLQDQGCQGSRRVRTERMRRVRILSLAGVGEWVCFGAPSLPESWKRINVCLIHCMLQEPCLTRRSRLVSC